MRKSLPLLMFLAIGLAACSDSDGSVPETPGEGGSNSDAGVGQDIGHSATDDAGLDGGNTHEDHEDAGGVDVNAMDTNEDWSGGCDVDAAVVEALGLVDAVSSGEVNATQDGDGWVLEIDASAGGLQGAASEPYIYVDIVNGEAVALTDIEALTSGSWWLAFKRTTIRANSGDSGPSSLLISRADGVEFATAPSPGPGGDWGSDEFMSDDCEFNEAGRPGSGTPQTAFGTWYDYNPETHEVSPTEGVVYFIYEPSSHAAFRLAIDGWDNGVFTLRVAPL